jgi:hypothetical protein
VLATEAEARGARVAFGRAWEVGGAPAYWPWSQALDELGLDLDELLGAAAGSAGGASGEKAGAQRIVAFDRVIRAVGEGGPVVVILDDLHAADVASLELALAFARAAARKRALLIVTTRESELQERRELGELVGKLTREGNAIPLARLESDDTSAWLASVGFEGDASEVHRLSEGNPLFIEEAVRLGVDRFATAAAGGVTVILEEHLGRISDKTRELLAVASIFGREASYADVATLAGGAHADVMAAAREGHHAGVLLPRADVVAFSHVLLRDALYETLAPARRSSLHARAAEHIEAEHGPPALVAQHLLAARDVVDAVHAVRTVCRAAEIAVTRHAPDSAAQLLASARTRLAGRLDAPTALMLDLAEAEASMRSAPSDEVRARTTECAVRAEQQGRAVEYARAALTYGSELLTGRVDPLMVTLLENALALLPEEERSLRARVTARLAAALAPATTDEGMVRTVTYARESIALARAQCDVSTLLYCLLWSTPARVYTTPLEERLGITTELVALAREHGDDMAIVEIGSLHAIMLLESGRPMAAHHEAEAYIRLVESLPLPAVQWRAMALRATMTALDGRIDEAKTYIEGLRREATTFPRAAGAWALFEVLFAASTGQIDRLREIDLEVTSILGRTPIFAPFRACVDALLGRRDAAILHLPPLSNLSRGLSGAITSAQVAVVCQSPELANELYEPLLAAAPIGRFFGGPAGLFPVGPVSRLLGELALLRGDRDRAREHFETALAECREMHAVPFLALTEQALARLGPASSAPAAQARPPARAPAVTASEACTLAREGDVWVVTSKTSAPFRVKHAKGIEYLDHLLKSPEREVYVLVLAGAEEGPEDAGAILDPKAKQAYQRRVEELDDQLSEALRNGDHGRASRARAELEAVAEQLASAVGLGGRDRKAASNVERARVNVQRRLKDAIKRIGEHDEALGRYLEAAVRTGTYCVYRPI